MSKLCLSTYLCILTLYKRSNDTGQFKILNGLIRCVCSNPEIIQPPLVSHIKKGERNLPRTIRDEIEGTPFPNPHYLDYFKANVEIFLHPGKTNEICQILRYIALNDDEIGDECVIDYISQTKKTDLKYQGDPIDFIAGVFLYVVRLENDKTDRYALEISEEFCKNAIKEYSEKVNNNSDHHTNTKDNIHWDSDIPSQAKKFCRDYEDSIELLPLCQIADIVNPSHNHINRMYSEYCNCSDKLKKQIMQDNDCPILNIDSTRDLYHLLYNFSDDIEKLGFASRNKTYMFPQYIVKSLFYEEVELIDPNPAIFPIVPNKLFPNHTKSTLASFLGDYTYYKNTDKAFPIPFDWMWTNLGFAYCKEEALIPWLNLFIIDCCNYINNPMDIMLSTFTRSKSTIIPVTNQANTHFNPKGAVDDVNHIPCSSYATIIFRRNHLISFENSKAFPTSPSTFSLPMEKAATGSSFPEISLLKSADFMEMAQFLSLYSYGSTFTL